MGEAPNGFHVLREHFEAGVDHGLHVRQHALEVRRERLDRRLGAPLLDGTDAVRVVLRPAVGQIVAIHGGEHDVLELHELDGVGDVLRFFGIEPAVRVAGVDRAEAAGARTPRPSA